MDSLLAAMYPTYQQLQGNFIISDLYLCFVKLPMIYSLTNTDADTSGEQMYIKTMS